MKSVLIAIVLAALCMICAYVAFEGARLEGRPLLTSDASHYEFKP